MNNILDSINADLIGKNQKIRTPFGEKPLVYADYTASGRSLTSIENFIQQEVMPFYANTHTEATSTGRQISAFREQARDTILNAVNGDENDAVIFCGSGATAAIQKLIDILNLRIPADLNQRYQFDQTIPEQQRPVVFIGPYEHHSNELPWRESIVDLVCIPLDSDGQIDLEVLEKNLLKYQARELKIGSFSAASNVTGLLSDTRAISKLLHKHKALSFWDYAAAAPYVKIDMNIDNGIDAVFISPHKFVGGPGTPGVLVVKKHLMTNSVPSMPGGGTVSFVTPDEHCYIADHQRREEGGTPAIIEAIRAGLVFQLQQQVGLDVIEEKEQAYIQKALTYWSKQENIEILGNTAAKRLSIVSFRIKHADKYLHYGFVVALLNDLFGIQSRGGCSCAGPYAHHLLGLDDKTSHAISEALADGHMIIRPGWTRINFNYFIDLECFEYLLHAVSLIARYGYRLLPRYEYHAESGTWRYQGQAPEHMKSIEEFILTDVNPTPKFKSSIQLRQVVQQAKMQLLQPDKSNSCYDLALPAELEALRWFISPAEALQNLRQSDSR